MARHARVNAPGQIIHVVTRFLNREFRLVGERERDIYLERLGKAVSRTDWTLLCFGLMSSHTHLGLVAGEDPAERWLRPLHTGVAVVLKQMHGGLGPLVAERPATIVVPLERGGEVFSYIHNNPGRAGLVATAKDSSWTSHRAWIGLDPAPDFLDVATGLRLAAFLGTELRSDGRRSDRAGVTRVSRGTRSPGEGTESRNDGRRSACAGHGPTSLGQTGRDGARRPRKSAPHAPVCRSARQRRMARHARVQAPGQIIHVITRFLNREFRLVGQRERDIYLERLGKAVTRTDWTLCCYGLMSSHTHLGLVGGEDPAERWLRPLHAGVAVVLKQMHGGLGPLVAQRPATIVVPPDRGGEVFSYIHNNPGRAGLVATAKDSLWTSHRAWIGLDPAPDFLDVATGLRLAGFDTTPEGRAAFDELVSLRAGEPRSATLSGTELRETRARVRRSLALPAEISSSVAEVNGSRVEILHPGPAAPRWGGDLSWVLAAVSSSTGVSAEEMRSPSRARRFVRARRIFAVACVVHLRRTAAEVCGHIAVSRPAVTALLRNAGSVAVEAWNIASWVRALPVSELVAPRSTVVL